MLETFAALRPADQPAPPLPQQAQQLAQQEPAGQPPAAPAATAEAARDFVRALDELPSEGELDAAAAAADAATAQAQQAQQAEGQHVPGWSSLLPRAHSLGASGQLDGSALRQVEAIPAVDSASVKAQVMAMTEPEHLVGGRLGAWLGCWLAGLLVGGRGCPTAGPWTHSRQLRRPCSRWLCGALPAPPSQPPACPSRSARPSQPTSTPPPTPTAAGLLPPVAGGAVGVVPGG